MYAPTPCQLPVTIAHTNTLQSTWSDCVRFEVMSGSERELLPNGEALVAILRRSPPLPTLVISDDVEAGVRRLRFFEPMADDASDNDDDDLVSDHIQSEMRLDAHGFVVADVLCLPYHALMLSPLCLRRRRLRRRRSPVRVCVLGHGAGALTRFCRASLTPAVVCGVERDLSVIEAAEKFFVTASSAERRSDEGVFHGTAEQFLGQCSSEKFNFILIDLNNSNESSSSATDHHHHHHCLAAPPALSDAFVAGLRSASTPSAIVSINVLGTSTNARRALAASLAHQFQSVGWLEAPQICLNAVLVASSKELGSTSFQEDLDTWLQQEDSDVLSRALGAFRSPTAISFSPARFS